MNHQIGRVAIELDLFRCHDDDIDRRALAACIMGARDRIPGSELSSLRMPVLVAVGSEDAIAGPPRPLAEIIPGAEALDITGRDHMKAVGDRAFKEGVLSFLRRRP